MGLSAVIIDDETQAISALKEELEIHFADEIDVVGACTVFDESIQMIRQNDPDIIFLDIQLAGNTGFDLLSKLGTIRSQVIFTTAYDNYAIKAIKFAALDYLLKPIDPEDIRMTLDRLYKYKTEEKELLHEKAKMLNKTWKDHSSPDRLLIFTDRGLEYIDLKDILYFKSDNNYCTLHAVKRRKIMITKTLKTFEKKLSEDGFLRVHNSYLVNTAHIQFFDQTSGNIHLDNQEVIPVSFRKRGFVSRYLTGA